MDDTTETPAAGADSGQENREEARVTPDAAPETPPVARVEWRPLSAAASALAGLQAGMIGVLAMLAWLGIDSSFDRRGFWREENLFSTLFYGDAAVRNDFTAKTLSGIALYLIIYSLLGCLFALLMRGTERSMRRLLAAFVFSLAWFYISFHELWKSAIPLAYLLYADQPMMVGHFIFGACIAGFPGLAPTARQVNAAIVVATPEIAPPVLPAAANPTPEAPAPRHEPSAEGESEPHTHTPSGLE